MALIFPQPYRLYAQAGVAIVPGHWKRSETEENYAEDTDGNTWSLSPTTSVQRGLLRNVRPITMTDMGG